MRDELLTRSAKLIGVVAAGIDERLAHAIAVDRDRRLVGVLLDDREQVIQQALLVLAESKWRRTELGAGRGGGPAGPGAQLARRGCSALRNRPPSS
jgi:hypothetical protein